MMRLCCISGPLQGREFAVDKDLFRIGASQDNDLVIADDYVSGNHAYLRYDRGTLRLTDQHSKNGTFVNNNRLQDTPITLNIGDQIRVGNSIFEVVRTPGQPWNAPVQEKQPPQGRDINIVASGEANRLPPPQLASQAVELWELPRLKHGQRLDLKAICDPYEKWYLPFVMLPAVIIAVVFVYLSFFASSVFGLDRSEFVLSVGFMLLWMFFFSWVGWKLFSAHTLGNSIKVGLQQYPQIHMLVKEASDILGIVPPDVFVMQGHGFFEVLVAKYFSRRGVMILMSNLVDDLTERGSSRELMFFIGRQLGLIATGFFRWWVFKHTLGRFALFFYWAWQRRCQFTADRLGLLVAGDLYAAEQALIIITAGAGIAANTNIDRLKQQRTELLGSVWAWINLALSSYPYLVDRIIRVREFAYEAAAKGLQANAPVAVAALPIQHRPIRALPLMIVHGHDVGARLELENFLLRQFPHVALLTMINETDAAHTLPEKFERIAGQVKGAIALLTPDDAAVTLRSGSSDLRARQNVIIEIGWVWGRLGRERCLVLTRGNVQIPSDLSGVEVHFFQQSPTECSERLRDFIAELEVR